MLSSNIKYYIYQFNNNYTEISGKKIGEYFYMFS